MPKQLLEEISVMESMMEFCQERISHMRAELARAQGRRPMSLVKYFDDGFDLCAKEYDQVFDRLVREYRTAPDRFPKDYQDRLGRLALARAFSRSEEIRLSDTPVKSQSPFS